MNEMGPRNMSRRKQAKIVWHGEGRPSGVVDPDEVLSGDPDSLVELTKALPIDHAGRPLGDYRADLVIKCNRCGAMLWHALADLTVAARIMQANARRAAVTADDVAAPETYAEDDGFAPFLVGLTDDAAGIHRLSHLHVPLDPMRGWGDASTSERQRCPNRRCGRAATISRRRTYQRLRALWEEAEAANEPRRAYLEV